MTEQNDDLTTDRDDDSSTLRALRAKVRELNGAVRERDTRISQLEPQIRSAVLGKLGFDDDSPQAKALSRLHEGDWTENDLRATAVEYGYLDATDSATSQRDVAESPAEVQREVSSERAQAVASAGSPVQPQTVTQQIADAEAKGDWPTAVLLKQQALADAPRS